MSKLRFTGNLTLPFLGGAEVHWPLPFLAFSLSCYPFPITAAFGLTPELPQSVTFLAIQAHR